MADATELLRCRCGSTWWWPEVVFQFTTDQAERAHATDGWHPQAAGPGRTRLVCGECGHGAGEVLPAVQTL